MPLYPASEPPRIHFEGDELCSDAVRARAGLAAAIEGARFPNAWALAIRIRDEPVAGTLRAEAEVTDASGATVARRVLSGSPSPANPTSPAAASNARRECAGLARAVGVWASLVLEGEADRGPSGGAGRVRAVLDPKEAPPRSEPIGPGPVASTTNAPRPPRPSAAAAAPDGAETAAEDTASDRADASRAIEPGGIELALGTLLMSGTGANALVGITPSVAVEVAPSVYFRPSLGVAESPTESPAGSAAPAPSKPIGPREVSSHVSSVWLTARFDACYRFQGSYSRNRGLALDACGGTEAGVIYLEDTVNGTRGSAGPARSGVVPAFALGPSLGLNGELGIGWAIALRAVLGINVIRPEFEDSWGGVVPTPPLSGRIELALSWRVR